MSLTILSSLCVLVAMWEAVAAAVSVSGRWTADSYAGVHGLGSCRGSRIREGTSRETSQSRAPSPNPPLLTSAFRSQEADNALSGKAGNIPAAAADAAIATADFAPDAVVGGTLRKDSKCSSFCSGGHPGGELGGDDGPLPLLDARWFPGGVSGGFP